MSDITLTTVASGYNLGKINENFETIKNAINDDVVHRVGGNNVMAQNLDMDDNRILNLPAPLTDSEPMTKGYGDVVIAEAEAIRDEAQVARLAAEAAELGAETARDEAVAASIDYQAQFTDAINNLDAEYSTEAELVIDSLGFATLDPLTFETGATITSKKQLLEWAVADGGTGFHYYWAGALPKTVAAASTPASSGGTGAGAWLIQDDLEQRLAAPDSTVLVGGVEAGILVATVPTIQSLLAAPQVTDRIYNVVGYHSGWAAVKNPEGGGEYVWDSSMSKSSHNGGTIIDPSKTYPTTWSDVAQQAIWFAADGVGLGCFVMKSPELLSVYHFGCKGDGVTLDLLALKSANSYLNSLGGGDLSIATGSFAIDDVLLLSAGVGLVGEYRANSRIVQTVDGADGVKLSGLNRLRHVRIEAPALAVSQASKGVDASDTSDNQIEDVRILHFGHGLYGTGLLWLHNYKKVRIENPRAYGVYMVGTDAHLEMSYDSIYVVNNSLLGATNKTSYYISGCKGFFMTNITSDGGKAVGTKNFGMVIINSNGFVHGSHWEGYDLPAFGTTAGVEFESLIRAKGSDLELKATHIQVALPTPADAAQSAIVYGEDSSRIQSTNLVIDSTSLAAYTTAHVALSNSFGGNECTLTGGTPSILVWQAGGNTGTARFFKEGNYVKQASTAGSFTIDVNKIGRLVINSGAAGNLTGFTGAHSSGQRVNVLYRIAGMTVQHSGLFRLQGNVNYSPNINSVQVFEYNYDGGFWSEISRNAS